MTSTNLFLLHVEVVDDDPDEEIEGEEGAEDDEEDKVEIHPSPGFSFRLLTRLKTDLLKSSSECKLRHIY